jgi:vaccinia related kinase
VEPHHNGPLFVELNFYCRAAKNQDIEEYTQRKNLSHLGVPDLKGSGSFLFRNKRLRFIVMPKYGADLQTILDDSKSHILSAKTASNIALQMLDCFEYLHSKGYVHKDLKGANVLFSQDHDHSKGAVGFGKVYLVDFGLVSKYRNLGLHKAFEPDQRSAHEGTLEYTSRDAHLGCVSRRGDIEVLLYVLIDWLGGKLPWDAEESLKPTVIQNMKIDAFRDVQTFLRKTFPNGNCPSFIESLMHTVIKTPFDQAPDYEYLRTLFVPYNTPVTPVYENAIKYIDEEDKEVTITKPMNPKGPSKRRIISNHMKKQRSTSQPWSDVRLVSYNDKIKRIVRQISEDAMQNPTYAMIEQLKAMQSRKVLPPPNSSPRRKGFVAKRRHRSGSFSSGSKKAALDRRMSLQIDEKGDGLRRSPRTSNGDQSMFEHLVRYMNPLKLVKSVFNTNRK